jgi:protein SCO1/2
MNCTVLAGHPTFAIRGLFDKAAEDSRTLPRPRDWRECQHAVHSARFWSAAVLCRFSANGLIAFFRRTFANNQLLALSTFLVVVPLLAHSAPADTLTDSQLAEIKFDQKLNHTISLNLHFRDEDGKDARLRDYFLKKPVILVLGYYGCPMLCTLVLNGMVEGLQDIRWNIGKEYEVINVSIDPSETPSLAAAKKRSYLKRYGRDGAEAGWHFLTGDSDATQRLADEVGFRYAYDSASKQYAHPSGLVILTPEGKISGYQFGVTYSPRELFASLNNASSRKISARIQDLILLCFHYRPITGRYGNIIMTIVRVLGVATLLGLPVLIVTMARKQKLRAVSVKQGRSCVSVGRPLHGGEGRGEGEERVDCPKADFATKPAGGPS